MFIINNKKKIRTIGSEFSKTKTISNYEKIRLTQTNDFFVKIIKKYDKSVILKIFLK
jgi:hypothetical protein